MLLIVNELDVFGIQIGFYFSFSQQLLNDDFRIFGAFMSCSYVFQLVRIFVCPCRTRLVAVATQKFVAEVANDALQYAH